MIGMLNIYHLHHDSGGSDCVMNSLWPHGHHNIMVHGRSLDNDTLFSFGTNSKTIYYWCGKSDFLPKSIIFL